MRGIIYKATNKFNGKVYIGQTVAGLATRKKQHQRDAKSDHGNAFHRALYQFPKSFDWEILDEFSGTREELVHRLNVAEEYHIIKYDSTNPEKGYNSTQGGYSSDKFADYIKVQSSSRKSKEMLQYDIDGNFLREFASLKEVTRFLGIDKIQAKQLTYGVHYNSQWRIKMSNRFPTNIGRATYATDRTKKRGRKVLVYDKDGKLCGVYEYIADAEREIGHPIRKIMDIGDGSIAVGSGRDFYVFDYRENYPEQINIIIENHPKRGKSVSAFDLNGNFVSCFPSISAAGFALHVLDRSILRYCRQSEPIMVSPLSRSKYVWRYGKRKDGDTVSVIRHQTSPREPRKKEYIRKMEHRIIQYTLEGDFVAVWDNTNQAATKGVESTAIIRLILSGNKPKKAPNFIWRYYTPDYPTKIEPWAMVTEREPEEMTRVDDTIVETDWRGDIVATYRDTGDAAEKTGLSQSYICNVIKGRIAHPKRRFHRA